MADNFAHSKKKETNFIGDSKRGGSYPPNPPEKNGILFLLAYFKPSFGQAKALKKNSRQLQKVEN